MDRFQIIRGEELPPNEFLLEHAGNLEMMNDTAPLILLRDPKDIKGLQDAWKKFSNTWSDG